MHDPLPEASRRLQRAWTADGLVELGTGLVFFLLAFFSWAKDGLDHADPLWRGLNLAQLLVMVPGAQAMTWALPRIRNRFLGHREGVMIPRMTAGSRSKAVMAAIVAASLGALLVVILRKSPNWAAFTILGAGFGTAGILCVVARAAGTVRYWVLAAAIVIMSAWAASRGGDFEAAFRLQFGFIGLALMGTGAIVLVRFLHTAPEVPR